MGSVLRCATKHHCSLWQTDTKIMDCNLPEGKRCKWIKKGRKSQGGVAWVWFIWGESKLNERKNVRKGISKERVVGGIGKQR